MKQLARWLWIAAMFFVPMAVVENRATAATITFTETITASGSLGANDFTNALVTITAIANTSAVHSIPGFSGALGVNDTSATITVAGIGTATFNGPVMTFVNTKLDVAGIDTGRINNPGVADILDVKNSAFSAYSLTSSIGPVSGPAAGGPGPYATTLDGFLANLTFDSFTGLSGTFEATIPEPSTFVCATSAVLWGLVYAYRRRRASVRIIAGPTN